MEDNKGRIGTYYLVLRAGMIRASGTHRGVKMKRTGRRESESERGRERERGRAYKEDELKKKRTEMMTIAARQKTRIAMYHVNV